MRLKPIKWLCTVSVILDGNEMKIWKASLPNQSTLITCSYTHLTRQKWNGGSTKKKKKKNIAKTCLLSIKWMFFFLLRFMCCLRRKNEHKLLRFFRYYILVCHYLCFIEQKEEPTIYIVAVLIGHQLGYNVLWNGNNKKKTNEIPST